MPVIKVVVTPYGEARNEAGKILAKATEDGKELLFPDAVPVLNQQSAWDDPL